jgi:hypothetical protein
MTTRAMNPKPTELVSSAKLPVFSTALTVLLVLYFLIPFALRTISNFFVYPAMLFPAGATSIPVYDGIAYFYTPLLFARLSDGKVVPIGTREFLTPMPPPYIWGSVTSTFGQSTDAFKTITIKHVRTFNIPRHVSPEPERRLALHWITDRVRQSAPNAKELLVRVVKVEFDLLSHREINRTTSNESALELP